jgi:tetratricopeptide (TPR) repeat protein
MSSEQTAPTRSLQAPFVSTALIVALLAIAAHARSLGCGWIWDDDSYITANPVLRSDSGYIEIFFPGKTPQYYPLVFLGFWIEFALVGVEPFLYHLVNVLMHAGSCVLLLALLRRLGVPAAAWIAAIFAVHPMGVETVAWVTERKNTQSMLLALASMLAFMRMLDAPDGRKAWPWLASLLLFIAALLSKTTAIFVAPCLVLCMLWRSARPSAPALVATAPFFAIGLALGLFTAFMEKTHVGAVGDEFALGIADRLQLAGKTSVFYLARFLVPTEQIFIYPRFVIDASAPAAWMSTATCALVAVLAFARWRDTRAPGLVYLWIGAGLFPALGFFDVWPFRYSFVADHFAYAAMPAFALVAVWIGTRVANLTGLPQRARTAAGVVAISALVALSIRATPKYDSEESLWRATLAKNPKAWMAANNLATTLLEEAAHAQAAGDLDSMRGFATEALEFARMAGAEKSDEFTNAVSRSEALRLLDRVDEAIVEIEVAIALRPDLPDLHWTHARLLERAGDADAAIAAYTRAADRAKASRRFAGDERDARRDLMRLAVARGDLDGAREQCERLIVLDPADFDARANLGAILVAMGRASDGRRALVAAAAAPTEAFSAPTVWIKTAARALQLALSSDEGLQESERATLTNIARRLAAAAPADPFARHAVLALAHLAGDARAAPALVTLEQTARAAGNASLADEIAAFLARHPASAAKTR